MAQSRGHHFEFSSFLQMMMMMIMLLLLLMMMLLLLLLLMTMMMMMLLLLLLMMMMTTTTMITIMMMLLLMMSMKPLEAASCLTAFLSAAKLMQMLYRGGIPIDDHLGMPLAMKRSYAASPRLPSAPRRHDPQALSNSCTRSDKAASSSDNMAGCSHRWNRKRFRGSTWGPECRHSQRPRA